MQGRNQKFSNRKLLTSLKLSTDTDQRSQARGYGETRDIWTTRRTRRIRMFWNFRTVRLGMQRQKSPILYSNRLLQIQSFDCELGGRNQASS